MTESTSTQSNESGLWSLVGKLSTIVALVASIIGLVSWFRSPDTKLSATIETSAYVIEPEILSFLDRLSGILSQENFSKLIEESPFFDEPKPNARAIEWLSSDIRRDVDRARQDLGRGYGSFWKTVLRNDGDLSLKDVSLRLPDASVSQIRFEDGTARLDPKGPTVEIGTLAPGQTVTVHSWGTSPYLSSIDFENVSVYHSNGRGQVIFPDEPSAMASFLTSPFALLLALPLIFLMAGIYQSGLEAGKKTREKQSAQVSGDEV